MKEFDVKTFDSMLDKTDVKNYINKLVDELRNDIEVYEIIRGLNLTVGEVRDNIAKLTNFKDDFHICKNCNGINKCPKDTPCIVMHLKKEGNFVNSSYEPCHKVLEKIAIDNKYLCADFPDEWKLSTIKTLDRSETRKLAIEEFVKILKGESSRWIFVSGNHKTGKSFLLVTFANEFASYKKQQVAVANSSRLISSLADSYYKDKDEFSRQMVALSNVDLLVLDDFGEEYKNEFIRDQIVLPLLSSREHNSKLTFFSSEFSIDEISKLYSIGKTSGPIRGRQLANILNSMCRNEFDITGASIYK